MALAVEPVSTLDLAVLLVVFPNHATTHVSKQNKTSEAHFEYDEQHNTFCRASWLGVRISIDLVESVMMKSAPIDSCHESKICAIAPKSSLPNEMKDVASTREPKITRL